MAIYLSDLMKNGGLVRGASKAAGEEFSFTGVVFIPSGTTIAVNSQLKIARMASGCNITDIVVRSNDLDSGAGLSISIGYERPTKNPELAYNATTNPYITGAVSAASLAYYAATATTPYQAGGVNRVELGQSALDDEFANNPTEGVSGITDLVLVATIAAAGATAADGYVWVTVKGTAPTSVPSSLSLNGYKSVY